MLFDVHGAYYPLTLSLIVIMGIVTAAFFFVVLTLALRARKRAIVTGQEGLIGAKGTVVNVTNKKMIVRVLGELWDAKSHASLYPGQEIVVTKVEGLSLEVKVIDKSGE